LYDGFNFQSFVIVEDMEILYLAKNGRADKRSRINSQ